jgi:cytochrome b561
MIVAAAGIIVLAVSVVRMFLRAGHHDRSDYVTQTVLTRIKAEYRDGQ